MATLVDVTRLVRHYESTFRSSNRPPFLTREVYDLFPSDGAYGWPSDWPHSAHAGVYAVLDESKNVLYVGKASSKGSSLGDRLSSYFVYENRSSGPCKVLHKWSNSPRYIAVFAVPDEHAFEAVSLEEFLIRELQPPDNTLGVKARATSA